MVIHEKWALEYEMKSSGLLMFYFNILFFRYFMWRFKRKYKRYMEFKKNSEQILREQLDFFGV